MKKLLLLLAVVCTSSLAQTFPTKPVKLIVTYPPGGSSDLMSRVYGAKLAELWGQQVIIESKPGAAGSIGMDFAAKQPNDGYTFVVGNLGPVAVNPLLSNVPYNIQKDFIAVSMISTGPNVLVVRTDSPFKSLKRCDCFCKSKSWEAQLRHQRPGQRVAPLERDAEERPEGRRGRGGVQGRGARDPGPARRPDPVHLLRLAAGDGAHPRRQAARAVRHRQPRYELLPEPPLCREAAPGLVAVNWWGVLLPAGSPKAVVDKLNADTVKALADPDVKKRFADLGVEAVSSTPAEFAAFIKTEMDKYAKLIKEANIKVNP